jgi:hypothetical protein
MGAKCHAAQVRRSVVRGSAAAPLPKARMKKPAEVAGKEWQPLKELTLQA